VKGFIQPLYNTICEYRLDCEKTCGIIGILGIFDIVESAKNVKNVILRN
jgi:hypothetical protein